MMRFSPPTEIMPEPTPEFVLNYDASCLPDVTAPENIVQSGNGDNLNWVTIPPLEGEFELSIITPIENNLSALSEPTIEIVSENPCPDDAGWCDLLEQGDVFTYVDFNQLISINRIDDVIIEFRHILPAYITNPTTPSWGVVDADTHHYRLAFNCTAIGYANRLCYWDSIANDYYYNIDNVGSGVISPDGQHIAQMIANAMWIWDLADNSYTAQQNLRDANGNPLSPFGSVRWSDANTIYYSAFPFGASSLNQQEIWRYDFDTTSNTKMVEPDTTNYRVPMPLYFDVRSDNLLYWMQNFASSGYHLNYLGNWSYTSPDFTYYGLYWSPRAGENRAIRVKTNSENANQYCIDTFQTASTPTNFNRITCRPMLFGFVGWTTGVDLEATIQVPPTEACLGELNARYGFRSGPFTTGTTVTYYDSGTRFEIIGTTGRWYYITYNGAEHWVFVDGVMLIDATCSPPLVTYNNGDVTFIKVIYDYELELPEGFWFIGYETIKQIDPETGAEIEVQIEIEVEIPDWESDLPEAKEYAKEWAYSYCTTKSDALNWQGCSMVIFFLYYQMFEQIYGRPPMMSDILATGYEVEVYPMVQRNRASLAEEALAGHYFQMVREYCHHVLNIGASIENVRIGEDGCYNQLVPSASLITGWRRKDQQSPYNNQGYFWTLEAWYSNATCLTEWYFGKQGEAIPDRTQITNLSELFGLCKNRLHTLLNASQEHRIIGLQQLTASKARNARFFDWGNYAYDHATHNGYLTDFSSPYNRAIRLWMNPNIELPMVMEHCHINLMYSISNEGTEEEVERWGEDIFAVIVKNGVSAGLGPVSSYNMSTHPMPAWVNNDAETLKFTGTTGIYRFCDCTLGNLREPNQNYPFNSRCEG